MLTKEIEENENYLEEIKKQTIDTKWIEDVKKYNHIKELNGTIVRDLVKRIDLFESGDVKVTFKFEDEYNLLVQRLESSKNNELSSRKRNKM